MSTFFEDLGLQNRGKKISTNSFWHKAGLIDGLRKQEIYKASIIPLS